MALRFYGKSNPGKQCPAMFRDAETGGFYVQGKRVTGDQAGELVVWLPASMIDIIRKACDDDLPDALPATGAGRFWKDPAAGDFYARGVTVRDELVLKRIEADSPILDDEGVVWLPGGMIDDIRKACDDQGGPGGAHG